MTTVHVHSRECIGHTELKELCCGFQTCDEESGYTVWLPGDNDGTAVFAASPEDAVQLVAVDRGIPTGTELDAHIEVTPRDDGYGRPR